MENILNSTSQSGRRRQEIDAERMVEAMEQCQGTGQSQHLQRPNTHDNASFTFGSAGGQSLINVKNVGVMTSANVFVDATKNEYCTQKNIMPKKPLTQSNDVPSDRICRKLSEELGQRWRKLGRHLGFSDAFLEQLMEDNRQSSERNYQMLLKWKERKDSEATKAVLSKELAAIGLGNLADELCD